MPTLRNIKKAEKEFQDLKLEYGMIPEEEMVEKMDAIILKYKKKGLSKEELFKISFKIMGL